MKYAKTLIVLLSLAFLQACTQPKDKLIGEWQYDSYEIDKSGIGTIASFLPRDWKAEIDKYITSVGNFSKGVYIFKEDGTFETSYSGLVEGFTKKSGNFALSPDFKTLTLKTGAIEKQLTLKELTDDHFTEVWEFDEYMVPLKINLKYKKILMN